MPEFSRRTALGLLTDAEGAATTPGTRAIIRDCTGGTNRQWNTGTDGTITGVHSGLCRGPNGGGTANSTPVTLQACTGGSTQKWARS
ncbi:RICIN domain-containing protein [Amycolatopsis sp. NBC_01488]|uniref:RICIN domain-containing protein n=1 Tax=Amycolatopsis sp. NBC_01488 TaxID=2903563 RepID=UPI002E2BCE2F|nr:RICIN domain-containing protein [Amycolatopsis sp. NBC_01488]